MKKALLLAALLATVNISMATDFSPISQSYYNKAVNLYSAGETVEAKSYFKKVLDIEPNYSDAYYNLGVILENEDIHSVVESMYKRVIEGIVTSALSKLEIPRISIPSPHSFLRT